MKKICYVSALFLMVALLAGCAPKAPAKAAAKLGINFGTAITPGDVLDPDKAKLISENYNTIVAENNMKWENIQYKKGKFNFSDMDLLVKFAGENGMKVRGHTFVWHNQNAGYVSSIRDDDELRAHLKDHITTIMQRYQGKIFEYDVCNEIFEEDGSFRNSFWYRRFGEEIYEYAFTVARQADPNARLVLNDYNNENYGNAKADAMYNFVKKLVEKGVPIDGVGLQLHLQENLPFDKEAIRKNVQRYGELGIDVSFTEVDVRLKTPAGDAAVANQARIYQDLMDICRTEKNCSTYVVWGLSDKTSWVPGTFPGYGDALPIDRDYKVKPFMKNLFK